MLKFFRSIRRKLLFNNKFMNYLLYAVGEILLVVIGILVALQVNNWNLEQKRKSLELDVLTELQRNLRADIEDMQANMRYNVASINSANSLLAAFDSEDAFHDSLKTHFGKVAAMPQFLAIKTAYETLKREGTRLIQNDSLRNKIVAHYELQYAFLIKFNDSEWQTTMQDFSGLYRKHFKKIRRPGIMMPADYENIRQNIEYRNYLNNRIGLLEMSIGLYQRNSSRSQELINAIGEELQRRK